jgi:quinol monooxygenase YgiN
LVAQPGKRTELVAILLRAAQRVAGMPGCRVYLVNEDLGEENTVWIYEAWDSKADHDASLEDAGVRGLIQEAMPLIAAPPGGAELRVAGGLGVQ